MVAGGSPSCSVDMTSSMGDDESNVKPEVNTRNEKLKYVIPRCNWNCFVLLRVEKLVPSYNAVYAIERPKAVLSECAELMVSKAEKGADWGRRPRIAVTPAVMFW